VREEDRGRDPERRLLEARRVEAVRVDQVGTPLGESFKRATLAQLLDAEGGHAFRQLDLLAHARAVELVPEGDLVARARQLRDDEAEISLRPTHPPPTPIENRDTHRERSRQ
jgi:hypothetical protein